MNLILKFNIISMTVVFLYLVKVNLDCFFLLIYVLPTNHEKGLKRFKIKIELLDDTVGWFSDAELDGS
jgi:hypothetical protein